MEIQCWLCATSPIFYHVNKSWNLTHQPGYLPDCALHHMASATVARNHLEVGPRFSPQFSQHLPHLVRTGQREQPLEGDASCPIRRNQGRFTFNFCEDILHKHLCTRNTKRHSQRLKRDIQRLTFNDSKTKIKNDKLDRGWSKLIL